MQHVQWRDQPQSPEIDTPFADRRFADFGCGRSKPGEAVDGRTDAGGLIAAGQMRVPDHAVPSLKGSYRACGNRLCSLRNPSLGVESGTSAAGFHWRSAQPELLLAMQEGGRSRMASLGRYAR